MKNQLTKTIFALSLSVAFFSSCKKDEPVAPSSGGQSIAAGDGVFVTNEGNFMGGNAKVSFYRYSDQTTVEDLFHPVNARQFSDVCQSMSIINGNAYLVVNNSGKIEVVTTIYLRSIGSISGFVSPRYILQVSPSKAYV